MGRRRKLKTTVRLVERSLEEQLREHDADEVPGDPVRDNFTDTLNTPSAERVEWVRKRNEILGKMRTRTLSLMADHPDEAGRFSPSPYLVQHGHVIEDAPRQLKIKERGKHGVDDSAFPKRIATQRMLDRYHVQHLITRRQWRGGDRLWRLWRSTGLDPKLCANYSPDIISSSGDPDARMVGRGDAMADYLAAMAKVGAVGAGVLVYVVVWDGSAQDWALSRGHSRRLASAVGQAFLSDSLDILAAHFGY